MITLSVASIIGSVLCAVLHFSSLFGLYHPPREVTLFLQIGFIVLFLFSAQVARKVRGNTSPKEFNRAKWNATPKWLRLLTGFAIIYAVMTICLSLAGDFPPDAVLSRRAEIAASYYRSFSAHWMAFYLFVFHLSYAYQCIEKERQADEREQP